MTVKATTWSATLATPRPRQLAPVKPPQTPGNQDNGQDSGSHRLRVGPMTDITSSVKEGPTQKEITVLQLYLEDQLLPPHHHDLQSVAGTHMLDNMYVQLPPLRLDHRLR